ncbi:unnamed protein product [Strongylus vulgaris]|uniref:Nematode cuticle collagen N-terminal domain-containing protein n=1 Tax=Strongylus vulgaris TaxID=40348 RepID=A0A3P7KMY5_STRVU|nr:unnamed protein product [Strongylus vulgaris]
MKIVTEAAFTLIIFARLEKVLPLKIVNLMQLQQFHASRIIGISRAREKDEAKHINGITVHHLKRIFSISNNVREKFCVGVASAYSAPVIVACAIILPSLYNTNNEIHDLRFVPVETDYARAQMDFQLLRFSRLPSRKLFNSNFHHKRQPGLPSYCQCPP